MLDPTSCYEWLSRMKDRQNWDGLDEPWMAVSVVTPRLALRAIEQGSPAINREN